MHRKNNVMEINDSITLRGTNSSLVHDDVAKMPLGWGDMDNDASSFACWANHFIKIYFNRDVGVKCTFPKYKYRPEPLEKGDGGEWMWFVVAGNIAGGTFSGVCSVDDGIRIRAVYPGEGGGKRAGTHKEKFCLNQSCSLCEWILHGRLSGRGPWFVGDFPFPGNG